MHKDATRLSFLVCVVTVTFALAQDVPYVIDAANNRIRGTAIKADDDGTIDLRIGEATRTFKKGAYRFAFTPKPREVALLERAFEEGKMDMVKSKSAEVFAAYRYLGWAGRIAYLEGSAYLAEKNAKEALRIFENGERFAGPNNDDLVKGKVDALIALDQNPKAIEMLEKLKASASADMAAFAFNASGKLLMKQGKKEEAVLQFLKTVLLFEPGTVTMERNEAKKQVVAILKDMGDKRWQDFEAMK